MAIHRIVFVFIFPFSATLGAFCGESMEDLMLKFRSTKMLSMYDKPQEESIESLAKKLSLTFALDEKKGFFSMTLTAKEKVEVPLGCEIVLAGSPTDITYAIQDLNDPKGHKSGLLMGPHDAGLVWRVRHAGSLRLDKGASLSRKDYIWQFKPALWKTIVGEYKKLRSAKHKNLKVEIRFTISLFLPTEDSLRTVDSHLYLIPPMTKDQSIEKWFVLEIPPLAMQRLIRLEKEWIQKGKPSWTDELPPVFLSQGGGGIHHEAMWAFGEFNKDPLPHHHPPEMESSSEITTTPLNNPEE